MEEFKVSVCMITYNHEKFILSISYGCRFGIICPGKPEAAAANRRCRRG